MFKLTAMVNFLIIDDKQTSIVCKVYEKMKIGDTFIHIDDKDIVNAFCICVLTFCSCCVFN